VVRQCLSGTHAEWLAHRVADPQRFSHWAADQHADQHADQYAHWDADCHADCHAVAPATIRPDGPGRHLNRDVGRARWLCNQR
jgi:hypothetical protein